MTATMTNARCTLAYMTTPQCSPTGAIKKGSVAVAIGGETVVDIDLAATHVQASPTTHRPVFEGKWPGRLSPRSQQVVELLDLDRALQSICVEELLKSPLPRTMCGEGF